MNTTRAFVETPRLRLRDWREDDFPAFAAMNADARVMEFFLETKTEAQSREFFARSGASSRATASGSSPRNARTTAPCSASSVCAVACSRRISRRARKSRGACALNSGARATRRKPRRRACASASTPADSTKSSPSPRSRTRVPAASWKRRECASSGNSAIPPSRGDTRSRATRFTVRNAPPNPRFHLSKKKIRS